MDLVDELVDYITCLENIHKELLGDILCNVDQYGYLTNDVIDRIKSQLKEL